MSITIKEAKKIGDKKIRAVGGSPLVSAIKSVLQSQNIALSVSEIRDELEKKLTDEEKLQLFATNDKTCFDTDGNLVADRVLRIRLNDLALNTRKLTPRVSRAPKGGVLYFYWNTEELELPTGSKE